MSEVVTVDCPLALPDCAAAGTASIRSSSSIIMFFTSTPCDGASERRARHLRQAIAARNRRVGLQLRVIRVSLQNTRPPLVVGPRPHRLAQPVGLLQLTRGLRRPSRG